MDHQLIRICIFTLSTALGCSDAGDNPVVSANPMGAPEGTAGAPPAGEPAAEVPRAAVPGVAVGSGSEGPEALASSGTGPLAAAAGADAGASVGAAPPGPAGTNSESCTGCARFSVPMNGADQFGNFELNLPASVDMSATTITYRLMAVGFTGNSGGVSVYVRDENNADQGFVWTNLTTLPAWTEVALTLSDPAPANGFDRSAVAKIGVQIHSGGPSTTANWQDAVVYLDSVRFSGGVSPDITFDSSIADLALIDGAPPPGTAVTFLGP